MLHAELKRKVIYMYPNLPVGPTAELLLLVCHSVHV